MVMDAAVKQDEGRDVRTEASMIKVFATEMATEVIDHAMQTFGAMGVTKELPLPLMAQKVRTMRIYEGPTEVHRMVIARRILGRPLTATAGRADHFRLHRGAAAMTYTLDAFIKDAQAALKAHDGPAGREQVRVLLEKLLTNEAFVDEAVGPAAPIGTRKLYEDKDLGFVVLAHCNPKPHKSPPHDHGTSWAVYGQAVKYTDMSEYKRLDGGNGAGDAKLEQVKAYRLEPGHAGVYDVGAVHAIDYPEGSRFVRVTGRDLDYVRRLKFDTAAGKAITIESASAS